MLVNQCIVYENVMEMADCHKSFTFEQDKACYSVGE
jgi:hypothetical protein